MDFIEDPVFPSNSVSVPNTSKARTTRRVNVRFNYIEDRGGVWERIFSILEIAINDRSQNVIETRFRCEERRK